MTCAACANRIQRRLTKLDGVDDVRVNFANGRATDRRTTAPPNPTIRAVIERLGYVAPVTADHDAAERRREADLRRRWIVALVLGVPVVLFSMVPALQFDGWEWVVVALATPVVFWCGWGFHRAAWMNLRHGTDHDGHARLDGHAVGVDVVDGGAARRIGDDTSTAWPAWVDGDDRSGAGPTSTSRPRPSSSR